jgi:hypothetical protein
MEILPSITAMITYQMTLDEFLACPAGPVGGPSLEFFDVYPDRTWVKGTEVVLTINPKYATAPVVPQGGAVTFANQLLLERITEAPRWQIVGGYIDTNILIVPATRGKRLSVELILRCAEHRPPPQSRILSYDGERALRSAHEAAVRAAVLAGLDVPDAVRETYGL